MKKIILLIVLIAGCTSSDYSYINSYEDCVNAGFPIMESYPEQCATPDGRSFTRVLDAFCGWSTNATCTSDDECTTGGCSSQVCQGVSEEPVVTTCEYLECYNSVVLGFECGCVNNECKWKSA